MSTEKCYLFHIYSSKKLLQYCDTFPLVDVCWLKIWKDLSQNPKFLQNHWELCNGSFAICTFTRCTKILQMWEKHFVTSLWRMSSVCINPASFAFWVYRQNKPLIKLNISFILKLKWPIKALQDIIYIKTLRFSTVSIVKQDRLPCTNFKKMYWMSAFF